MNITFHFRARAVIYKDGNILLTTKKGGNYTFLPGGHIELGEKAAHALVREIKEELGEDSSVKSFLGAIENSWEREGTRHHEINLIFEVTIPGIETGNNPVAKENHIEFSWAKMNALDNANVLPPSLSSHLVRWAQGNKEPWWGSHFE